MGNDLNMRGDGVSDAEEACFELVGALNVVMGWIKAWDCDFVMDDEWPADEAKIKAALMRAAAIMAKGTSR